MMDRKVMYSVVMCKEMPYKDIPRTNENVKVIADSPRDTDMGVLACHLDSAKFEWISSDIIQVRPFEKFTDIVSFYLDMLGDFSKYIKEKCKEPLLSEAQKREIYTINRHIKYLQTSCKKLI